MSLGGRSSRDALLLFSAARGVPDEYGAVAECSLSPSGACLAACLIFLLPRRGQWMIVLGGLRSSWHQQIHSLK